MYWHRSTAKLYLKDKKVQSSTQFIIHLREWRRQVHLLVYSDKVSGRADGEL
jgi:hypothetical protein